MRELEEENNRLKRILTDLSIDRAMLQDVIDSRRWPMQAEVGKLVEGL